MAERISNASLIQVCLPSLRNDQKMEKSIFDLNHQKDSIDAKIVVALERIAEVFRVLLWNIGKQHKLSPLQIQILIFLKFHSDEKCKVSYLAKEFGLSKPTISEAIRTLLKKELINKEVEPSDTRSYSIHLTDPGEALVKEVSFFANGMTPAIGSWEDSRKADFYKNLLELINSLQKLELISIQRTCFNCQYFKKKGEGHYCQFLKVDLTDNQLQVDCADFEAI